MNTASLLIAASASIVGVLGTIHMLYTFRGNKLDPRDPAVRAAMERTHPVITRQTTVWRATKGFNASHSLGLIAFAGVFIHLALWRSNVLAASPFLLIFGMGVLLAYLVLARQYFFSIPFSGIAFACALFATGSVLL